MKIYQIYRRLRYIDRKLERPHRITRKKLQELHADRDRCIRMLPRLIHISSQPLGHTIPLRDVQGTFRYETL